MSTDALRDLAARLARERATGSTRADTRTRLDACPHDTNYDGPRWPWLTGSGETS